MATLFIDDSYILTSTINGPKFIFNTGQTDYQKYNSPSPDQQRGFNTGLPSQIGYIHGYTNIDIPTLRYFNAGLSSQDLPTIIVRQLLFT
jgi:hypothetical protein